MLKRLHKIIGLSISIIVVHLAVTGLLLMYPYTFKLTEIYFNNNFLYSLYNMYKSSDVRTLNGSEEIGLVDSKIIFSDIVIETNLNNIISAANKNEYIYVISSNALLVLKEKDLDLEIVEALKPSFVVKSIGTYNNNVVVMDISNNYYYIKNNFDFSLIKDNNIEYKESHLVFADKELSNYFLIQVQGPGIQALRLVADLHNGRFFGSIVVFVFFIASILIIFLAISGTYITIRPEIKRYFYKKNKKRF